MDWQTASDILARNVGKHGTFVGITKEGFVFGLGSGRYVVTDGGQILNPGEQSIAETSREPKKVSPQVSAAPKAMLAMIGENTTVHMAVLTPSGQTATACNPKKTFYSSQGAVRPVEGSLDQVTCKVCGWAIAKMQKAKVTNV